MVHTLAPASYRHAGCRDGSTDTHHRWWNGKSIQDAEPCSNRNDMPRPTDALWLDPELKHGGCVAVLLIGGSPWALCALRLSHAWSL